MMKIYQKKMKLSKKKNKNQKKAMIMRTLMNRVY
jgi:hypothetical protein